MLTRMSIRMECALKISERVAVKSPFFVIFVAGRNASSIKIRITLNQLVMNQDELHRKLDEFSRSIDELYEMLGLPPDSMKNDVDYDEDEDYDDEFDELEDDDEFGSDEDSEEDDELDGACGVGIGFDLSKLFDPRYNEHILSEPDENGMVEISDELYDRLYGKYHSKEDMLDDIIGKMDFYISGKYCGDEEYWAETRYLGINKESNRPCIGTLDELDDEEYDIYDIKEFEDCYWTNADDIYADYFEYKLMDDTAMRKLIDKYYPDLEW